jgi:hypothetical protein
MAAQHITGCFGRIEWGASFTSSIILFTLRDCSAGRRCSQFFIEIMYLLSRATRVAATAAGNPR